MNANKVKMIAYLLVALGILWIMLNSGILGALPSFIWVCLMFCAGIVFWLGSSRLGFWQRLAVFAGIGVFAIITSGRFAGTAALGFPAIAFILTYLVNAKHWWTIIPGGILGSVSLLVMFNKLFPRWDTIPILFLGFAATFSYLYLLPTQKGGKRWALFPAILFILLTVLINDPGGRGPNWLLPLILIGGGSTMLWWWRKNNKQ
jgi:hypothetical protein